MSQTYALFSRPFYKSCDQCYIKILTIDREPAAPLSNICKRVSFEKLSPFKQPGPCEKIQRCGYAIMNPNMTDEFATLDDLPLIFSWLLQNLYQVNTAITDMLNKSEVRMDNKLICFISR